MGLSFKLLTSSAWLFVWVIVATSSATAQKHYPSIEDAWDGTDYRALIQRFEDHGLALPTIADEATKPVFERMVNSDNIPLRMGLNPKLSVTIRFQKLDSALDPVHKLVVIYSNEIQKGKPYAAEHASLMVYEAKVSAAMLDVTDSVIATLDKEKDKRYQARIDEFERMKNNARQLYSGLVAGMSDTKLYAKSDILKMVKGALDGLRSYQPILSDQNRQELMQKLAQQISATTDQELKSGLTELRDALEHRRVRT
jgi:hypothetical protein